MERYRSLGRRAKCYTGLGGHRVPFGTLWRGLPRVEVMNCQGTGQFLVAERLEVPRRGQVPRTAVALGQSGVSNLPEQPLHKAILPALRGQRIGVVLHYFAPNK